MIFRYDHLHHYSRVFRLVTGLTPSEFHNLVADVAPTLTDLLRVPLQRPNHQRAISAITVSRSTTRTYFT